MEAARDTQARPPRTVLLGRSVRDCLICHFARLVTCLCHSTHFIQAQRDHLMLTKFSVVV